MSTYRPSFACKRVLTGVAILFSAVAACGGTNSVTPSVSPGCNGDAGSTDSGEDAIVVAYPDPGEDGGSGDASCNASGEPSVEPCLVSDALGVFVSAASGGDMAAGTKGDPLRTMTEGIAKAAGGSKRVFVCAGTYDEHVVVAVGQDGVRVYGGFDCGAWAYASGNAVRVAPSTPGYALKVDSLTVGVTFEDIEFDSHDAQVPGDSSIAVFANQSVATFRRVVMTAGNGAPGAQGDTGVSYTAVQAPSGNNADGGAGGASQSCSCLDGDRSAGGAGGNAGAPASAGLSGLPEADGGRAGAGGDLGCSAGGLGHSGADGPDAPAVAGATGAGRLTAQGWSSAEGNPGAMGPAAQGGGGGGGNSSIEVDDAGLSLSGGGGSGGCGGCGGEGGTPGQGGGSSFALLSYKSTIALVSCRLAAHDGKNGGAGGNGQAGEFGGDQGISSEPGCMGGNGGNGGGGGGGGGGAGGVSVAIDYIGDAPTETNTLSKTVGFFGTGGPGGHGGGAGNAGGKGVDGVASVVLSM